MNVIIIIGSLAQGGAERVAVTLSEDWCKTKEFKLLTFRNDSDFYSLSSDLKRDNLGYIYNYNGIFSRFYEEIRRFFILRRYLKKNKNYKILSLTTDVSLRVLLASVFLDMQVYVSEHSNFNYLSSKFKRILRRELYKRAKKVVLLTNRDCKSYINQGLLESSVMSISNPLNLHVKCTANNLNGQLKLLAVGRLESIKAFDEMIEIVKGLQIDFILNIVGNGSQYSGLKLYIKNNYLDNKVFLLGHQSNMEKVYSNHDILLMTSKMEGLPMAIIEANSQGLPVISYNCPTGPEELIDSETGFLIENLDRNAFLNAIYTLYENPDLYAKMSEAALKKAEDFNIERINEKWDSCFHDVL